MIIQSTIQDKLDSAITCTYLEVINESNQHNVPPGSESHFKVVVVSDEFEDKSLVIRHRFINEILSDELSNSIHALAIHAYTSREWAEKNNSAPESPPCKGGGK